MRHRKRGARALKEGRRVVCDLRESFEYLTRVPVRPARLHSSACAQSAVRAAAARHLEGSVQLWFGVLEFWQPRIIPAEDGGSAPGPASRAAFADPPPTTHRPRFRALRPLAMPAAPQQPGAAVQSPLLPLGASRPWGMRSCSLTQGAFSLQGRAS